MVSYCIHPIPLYLRHTPSHRERERDSCSFSTVPSSQFHKSRCKVPSRTSRSTHHRSLQNTYGISREMNGQFFETPTIANYSYIPNVKCQFKTLPFLTVIHFLFSDGDGDDDEDDENYDDGDFGGSDNDHDDDIIQLSLHHINVKSISIKVINWNAYGMVPSCILPIPLYLRHTPSHRGRERGSSSFSTVPSFQFHTSRCKVPSRTSRSTHHRSLEYG